MKNLFSTLILAGSLILGGCGNKKEFIGKVISFNENFKNTSWKVYCLVHNKDTLLIGSRDSVNPFNKGDSVKVKYKPINGKNQTWNYIYQEVEEQEYSMNQLLNYQIISKAPIELSELEKYNQLQSKYDSLKTKYDYWIKRYVDCQGEKTQDLVREIEIELLKKGKPKK